ncbi:hypothetical protein KY285_021350 [Solanum tuberosum]|nr:hypothetical protein KY285_021350 [Solanum tuberosum]
MSESSFESMPYSNRGRRVVSGMRSYGKEYITAFLIREFIMIVVFCILDLLLFYVLPESVLIPMLCGAEYLLFAGIKRLLNCVYGKLGTGRILDAWRLLGDTKMGISSFFTYRKGNVISKKILHIHNNSMENGRIRSLANKAFELSLKLLTIERTLNYLPSRLNEPGLTELGQRTTFLELPPYLDRSFPNSNSDQLASGFRAWVRNSK